MGAGLMGTAIAVEFLRKGYPVVLFDRSAEVLQLAPARISDELEIRGITEKEYYLKSIVCTSHFSCLHESQIYLETITEKIRIKQSLYQQFAPFFSKEKLVLSNTSTISIETLAAFVPFPDRFCGFHFFHPVRERPLLEIVRGPETSPETVEQAETLAREIGKIPMVVNDGPGFLVNRLLNPYLAGALELLLEGAEIQQVDDVMTQYGMAMGPFQIMDEIGLDVTLHGGWTLYKAFPDRMTPSPILLEMVHRGFLGRKTGQGFMRYTITDSGVFRENNREVGALVVAERRKAKSSSAPISGETIVERLVRGIREESHRILEDKVVKSSDEIHLAMTLGLGFPDNKSLFE